MKSCSNCKLEDASMTGGGVEQLDRWLALIGGGGADVKAPDVSRSSIVFS